MSSIAPASGASGSSSIGGNTAPSSGGASSTGTSGTGGTAIGGNTAPSRSFAPTTRGVTYGDIKREQTTPLFDRASEEAKLADLQANIMQQKMTAQMLKGFVDNENKAFEDWTDSMNLELTEIGDLEDFLDAQENNTWTNDATLNEKIEKVTKFIPDIIEAISKKEGVGTALKVAEGESVVVDTAKQSIEKVIAPALKRLSSLVESRFSSEMGKQVAEALGKAATTLEGLPSKVLGVIGPIDVATSILDLGLAIAAKASGSYRESHHNLPDWLKSTPIIGGIASSAQSIRDLIDTAAGIPTNKEGAEKIRETLYNDLWKPMMDEYGDIVNNIAEKSDEVSAYREQMDSQMKRLPVQEEVAATIDGVVDLLGRDVEAIKDQQIDNLGLEFNADLLPAEAQATEQATLQNRINELNARIARDQEQVTFQEEAGGYRLADGFRQAIEKHKKELSSIQKDLTTARANEKKAIENDALREAVADIETIAQRELGLLTDADAEDSLVDVETPELLEEVVAPVELEGRLLLDNMFSLRDQLELANGYLESLRSQIRDAERRISQSSTILAGGKADPNTILMADRVRQKAIADKARQERELSSTESVIPELENSIDELQGELEGFLTEHEGEDLSFMEASTNFDEALAAIQDDSRLWERVFENIGQATRGFDYF